VAKRLTNQPLSVILSLLLGVLILGLFLYYFWAINFKGLNSDHAIHALMARKFQLDENLYYWGQDRLGSFIPMLAAPLQNLGIPSLWAASISQLLVILSTFYFLQKHFSHAWFKLAMALILFLPIYPFLMQVMIGHPYLAHHFFTAAFLALPLSTKLARRWQAMLLPVLMGLALWSSELALVGIIAFALCYPRFYRPLLKKHALFFTLGVLFSAGFLYYAKATAHHLAPYQQTVASWPQIQETVTIYAHHLGEVLQFAGNKPYNSFLAYVLIIQVGVLGVVAPWRSLVQNRFFLFSVLTAGGTVVAVVISAWAVFMSRPFNYFVPAFFFLLLAFLAVWQEVFKKWQGQPVQRMAQTALGLYLLAHLLASLIFIEKHSFNFEDRLTNAQSKDFAAHLVHENGDNELGFMSTYWNAYLTGAQNDLIFPLPCQGSEARYFDYYLKMFRKPVVFVRNGCVPELRDTLIQQKQVLVKTSPVHHWDTLDYAYYRGLGMVHEVYSKRD